MGRINFQELERETVAKLPLGGAIVKGSPQKPRVDRNTGQPILKNGQPQMIQGDDLDHFRLSPDASLVGFDFEGQRCRPENDMATALMQRWNEVYGESPRSLNILFLGARMSDVFQYSNQDWRRPRGGGKGFLVRRCDGTRILQERQQTSNGFQLFFDPVDEQGNYKRCACLNEEGNEIHQDCPLGCSAKAALTVVLPDLGIPRQFVFRTGALNDIREIMRNLRPHDGALNAAPFRLVRTQREVLHRKDDGSMTYVRKWLVHVELAQASGIHFLQARQQRNFAVLEGSEGGEAFSTLPEASSASHPDWMEALTDDEDEDAYMIDPTPAPKPNTTAAASNGSASTVVSDPSVPQSAVETAQARASEVAQLRNSGDVEVSAKRVREIIREYQRRDGSGQAASHPAHLTNEDYSAVLTRIRQEGQADHSDDDTDDDTIDAPIEDWEAV